jgi:PPOX class probable F420-dependent enzyme
VSRRDQIRLTPDELAAFLEEQRTVTCATIGRDGRPHLMPLWYVVRDGELWAWTYAKSQKVRNLERDPRCTLQVEAGERYEELRGVMFEADVTIHRDLDTVLALGMELMTRYGQEERAARTQAPKRVALQFTPTHIVSWDHRLFSVGRGASR